MTSVLHEIPVKKPTIAKTMLAMLAREFRVMRHNLIGNVVRIILQPLLFVFVFVYILPKTSGGGIFAGGDSGSTFSTILVPGLIGSSMIMQSMMAIVFPLTMELSWQRSIVDRVLAPIPVALIAVEKIIAAAIQGMLAGLLVLPVVDLVHARGQEPNVRFGDWPLFILVMLVGSLLASAAGLYLGTIIDPKQTQVLFTIVMLPAIWLGCVYFPWSSLSHLRWLQILVLVNPLVYVSEGLRAALTPQVDHMTPWAFLPVMILGTALVGWLATRTFTRRVLS